MKHKALQLMPAEKAQRAKSCHVHQQDYKSALSEAQATIMAEAMKLWEQFGGHSVDCYYKEIIQCSQLNCGKWKVMWWNMYLKWKVHHLNDGRLVFIFAFFFLSLKKSPALPADKPHKKVGELTAQIAQQWNTMTCNEQIAITNDGLKVLEDKWEMK